MLQRRLFPSRSFRITLLIALLVAVACGCAGATNGREETDQTAPGDPTATPEATAALVHEDELLDYLGSQFLLSYLDAVEVVVLEADVDRVTIGAPDSLTPLGEVYYTMQDGWHLKRSNEHMEHRPGQGWLIWEQ